jgi:hypothetical protein
MSTHDIATAMVAAYCERYELTGPFEESEGPCLAAALRVMVDQVLPEMPEPEGAASMLVGRWSVHMRRRAQLQELCDVLEGLG